LHTLSVAGEKKQQEKIYFYQTNVRAKLLKNEANQNFDIDCFNMKLTEYCDEKMIVDMILHLYGAMINVPKQSSMEL